MKFKRQEIQTVTTVLASLLAGLPLAEAVKKLAKSDSKHGDMWLEFSERVSNGERLSPMLEGIWPDAVCAALRAGEESGSLEETLEEISRIQKTQGEVIGLAKKLIGPFMTMLAGLGVFVFFMFSVIPSFPIIGEKTGIQKLSDLFISTWDSYSYVILAVIAGLGILVHQLSKSDEFKAAMLGVCDQIPGLGSTFRKMFFSIWARYLSLLFRSGLPAKQTWEISAKVLPPLYQEEAQLLIDSVEVVGMAASVDPEILPEDDPRQRWPDLFVTPVMSAESNGALDVQLDKFVDNLQKESIREFEGVLGGLKIFATLFAAVLAVAPMLGYFMNTAQAIQNLQ